MKILLPTINSDQIFKWKIRPIYLLRFEFLPCKFSELISCVSHNSAIISVNFKTFYRVIVSLKDSQEHKSSALMDSLWALCDCFVDCQNCFSIWSKSMNTEESPNSVNPVNSNERGQIFTLILTFSIKEVVTISELQEQ